MTLSPSGQTIARTALVAGALLLIAQLRFVAVVSAYVPTLIGALLLWSALRLAEREGLSHHGLTLGGVLGHDETAEAPAAAPQAGPATRSPSDFVERLLRLRRILQAGLTEIGAAAITMLVAFPLFALGFWIWHQPANAWSFNPPPMLPSRAIAELLIVALPEEAFFRGWLQTRLTDHWPAREGRFGIRLPLVALVTQAALFALLHLVVEPSPARLAVFFPGLLFGVMRAWRGGIGAAVVLHAGSNLYSEILARGWMS